ncbi:MAG: ABC transporter ATP-binding protein [Anditalea sp.]
MSILSIQQLYKKYGKEGSALEDFSMEISKGSIWSLVGESGSGKSTLLKIIAGLEVQDQGAVYLKGNKILNPAERLVAGYEEIQLIHQQNNLYPHSTVEENIARPLLQYDKRYKMERVEILLELLHLQQHRGKLPKQLSGGQQQKVAIGRALSIEPEILLLDEPFSSLDNIQKRGLIEELEAMFEKLEVTVIFVTHDIDDAMTMTDQLCIIKKGKLIQKGLAHNLYERPESLYVAKLFSELNPLPEQPNSYVRPSELMFTKESNGIKGEVISKQYLVSYNRLTILLREFGLEWKVEDRERKYEKGDQVYIGYEEEKILKF